MSKEMEQLVVQLSADFRAYQRELSKNLGITNRQARAIEDRYRQMNRNLDGIGKQAARSIMAPLAGIGAALGTRELIRLTDVWTDLNSRVRIAAGGLEEGRDVMERLGEMARRTYSSLELTAEGYLLNSTTLRDLGYSTAQTLDYQEALNNALVVSGAKADRAARVQEALAKAMALGKLQGDNLNTVISTGGRVAEALAAGLGTSVSGLRQLGAQGKITGNDVVRALTSQMQMLREEAESMPATISDGFQLLNNALLEYVGNADQATGVSARVADALIFIADNFEGVADKALIAAGVIAGALVGRSMTRLIGTVATGTSGLFQLARALTAVRTAGGLAAALGGMGSAAGPAGLVVGGALVAALVSYQKAASRAEEGTRLVIEELERLGLAVPDVSDSIVSAADALDDLASDERRERLRRLNEELERMRGSGGALSFLSDDPESLGQIASRANFYANAPGPRRRLGLSSQDTSALAEIEALALAFQRSEISSRVLQARLEHLRDLDLSRPVIDLMDALSRTTVLIDGTELALVGQDALESVDEARELLAKLASELAAMENLHGIDDAIVPEIERIIQSFLDGQESAEQTKRALEAVASGEVSGNVQQYIAQMTPLLSFLARITSRAEEAAAAVAKAAQAAADERIIDGYRNYQSSRQAGAEMQRASEAYVEEQRRYNALKKEERDLEDEIARVRKQAERDQQQLTEAQIQEIAKMNIARQTADREAGRAGGRSGGRGRERDQFQKELEQTRRQIEAFYAEAEALDALSVSSGAYADALEYASKMHELLIAAQEEGLTITPALRSQIEALAQEYVNAGNEADRARERHEEFENALEDFRSTAQAAFRDLRKGADAFRASLSRILDKLSDMMADRAFNLLFGKGTAGGNILAQSLSWLGFAAGGYTGPGSTYEPAGVVHKGEYVFSKAATDRIGVGNLEAMHRSAKGYASGGYTAPVIPSWRNAAQVPQVNVSFAFDARGADRDAVAELNALWTAKLPEMKRLAVSAVQEARSKGLRV